MKEEIVYKWIMIKEDGSWKGQWSQAEEPKELEGYTWVEWNKPLPADIDEKEYTLEELEK